ncbi:MAG: endo alpha-1,4 polygalactosaminidase, partial [Butyrivibrio sp.]|nr:endo alpha-1,4 polygalactosaminidase [Butyrivibrio sp.]
MSYEGDLDRLSKYDTVVIDAQYFEAADIAEFRNEGHKVYSYINVGSLENFRDYYAEYQDLTLDVYENWEDEKWVDATSESWQSFILDELTPSLLAKNIDGFFVDNCDVYYMYPDDEMLDGIATIMNGLVATVKEVIMNGGDAFIEGYTENGGNYREVITGINQESVFTRIDWEKGSFHGS